MHHKGRNTHHYEYWQDNFDKGGQPVQMPYKDAVEMLCDYLGAGRAYMGKDFTYQKEYEWWGNKISKPIAMHEHTKTFIQHILANLKYEEATGFKYCIFNKKDLHNIYDLDEVRLKVREEFDLG